MSADSLNHQSSAGVVSAAAATDALFKSLLAVPQLKSHSDSDSDVQSGSGSALDVSELRLGDEPASNRLQGSQSPDQLASPADAAAATEALYSSLVVMHQHADHESDDSDADSSMHTDQSATRLSCPSHAGTEQDEQKTALTKSRVHDSHAVLHCKLAHAQSVKAKHNSISGGATAGAATAMSDPPPCDLNALSIAQRPSKGKRTVALQVGSMNEKSTQVMFDQRRRLLYDGSNLPAAGETHRTADMAQGSNLHWNALTMKPAGLWGGVKALHSAFELPPVFRQGMGLGSGLTGIPSVSGHVLAASVQQARATALLDQLEHLLQLVRSEPPSVDGNTTAPGVAVSRSAMLQPSSNDQQQQQQQQHQDQQDNVPQSNGWANTPAVTYCGSTKTHSTPTFTTSLQGLTQQQPQQQHKHQQQQQQQLQQQQQQASHDSGWVPLAPVTTTTSAMTNQQPTTSDYVPGTSAAAIPLQSQQQPAPVLPDSGWFTIPTSQTPTAAAPPMNRSQEQHPSTAVGVSGPTQTTADQHSGQSSMHNTAKPLQESIAAAGKTSNDTSAVASDSDPTDGPIGGGWFTLPMAMPPNNTKEATVTCTQQQSIPSASTPNDSEVTMPHDNTKGATVTNVQQQSTPSASTLLTTAHDSDVGPNWQQTQAVAALHDSASNSRQERQAVPALHDLGWITIPASNVAPLRAGDPVAVRSTLTGDQQQQQQMQQAAVADSGWQQIPVPQPAAATAAASLSTASQGRQLQMAPPDAGLLLDAGGTTNGSEGRQASGKSAAGPSAVTMSCSPSAAAAQVLICSPAGTDSCNGGMAVGNMQHTSSASPRTLAQYANSSCGASDMDTSARGSATSGSGQHDLFATDASVRHLMHEEQQPAQQQPMQQALQNTQVSGPGSTDAQLNSTGSMNVPLSSGVPHKLDPMHTLQKYLRYLQSSQTPGAATAPGLSPSAATALKRMLAHQQVTARPRSANMLHLTANRCPGGWGVGSQLQLIKAKLRNVQARSMVAGPGEAVLPMNARSFSTFQDCCDRGKSLRAKGPGARPFTGCRKDAALQQHYNGQPLTNEYGAFHHHTGYTTLEDTLRYIRQHRGKHSNW